MGQSTSRDERRLRSVQPLSWPKKILFASLTTLLFFTLLELALAMLQVQPSDRSGDPFVGFSKNVPLFEEVVAEDGTIQMRTAPGKLVWFNSQSFAKEKPQGTRRVFCLGGSTTFGRPFSDPTSFCGWLREFLPHSDPEVRWEVINAGGVSYASYRVAALMEELTQYDPDLFVVFSGHNEFLERRTYANMFDRGQLGMEVNSWLHSSRTWSLVREVVGRSQPSERDSREVLPEEVDEILNHSAGPKHYHRDDRWSEQVYLHYEWNLKRMVQIARDADAEIVLCNPASNLRDCSPFKSECEPESKGATDGSAGSELDRIRETLLQNRFDEAIALASQVVERDPRCADAQYLLGKAHFGLGNWASAEDAFQRAMNEDVCPLRATSRISEIIRRVAEDEQVILVDFERKLRRQSEEAQGHACFGGEYFLDHVHPTIEIHRELSLWILDSLLSAGWIDGTLPNDQVVKAVSQRVEASIDLERQAVAFRNLAKVLHWAGKFHEAIPRAQDAIRLLPEDLESRFVLADCLYQTGHVEQSLVEYRDLMGRGDYPRAYLPYAELLMDRGAFREAKVYLLGAILSERKEHRIRAYYDLGMVHLELGEYDFAVESLRECDRLYPEDPATLALIAEAESARGNGEAAVGELRRLVKLDPANFYAHYRLAEVLIGQGRLGEAKGHVDRTLQLEPTNESAKRLRENWQQQAGTGSSAGEPREN